MDSIAKDKLKAASRKSKKDVTSHDSPREASSEHSDHGKDKKKEPKSARAEKDSKDSARDKDLKDSKPDSHRDPKDRKKSSKDVGSSISKSGKKSTAAAEPKHQAPKFDTTPREESSSTSTSAAPAETPKPAEEPKKEQPPTDTPSSTHPAEPPVPETPKVVPEPAPAAAAAPPADQQPKDTPVSAVAAAAAHAAQQSTGSAPRLQIQPATPQPDHKTEQKREETQTPLERVDSSASSSEAKSSDNVVSASASTGSVHDIIKKFQQATPASGEARPRGTSSHKNSSSSGSRDGLKVSSSSDRDRKERRGSTSSHTRFASSFFFFFFLVLSFAHFFCCLLAARTDPLILHQSLAIHRLLALHHSRLPRLTTSTSRLDLARRARALTSRSPPPQRRHQPSQNQTHNQSHCKPKHQHLRLLTWSCVVTHPRTFVTSQSQPLTVEHVVAVVLSLVRVLVLYQQAKRTSRPPPTRMDLPHHLYVVCRHVTAWSDVDLVVR